MGVVLSRKKKGKAGESQSVPESTANKEEKRQSTLSSLPHLPAVKEEIESSAAIKEDTTLVDKPDTSGATRSESTFSVRSVAKGKSRFSYLNLQSRASLRSARSPVTRSSKPADLEGVEITLDEAAKFQATTPEEMWSIVKKSSSTKQIDVKPAKTRKGWKTIRLFVSSTFKDFHQEREVLVKQVFPDLRLWCESRKLRLVECDLRWGVPKDATTEDTIKICLSELDRCYEDNAAPFFLNLSGNRAGWIPSFDDLSYNLAAQYGWVHGLTVTEMEIVHGAIRRLNPNALFLLRKVDGAEKISVDIKDDYFNEDEYLKDKITMLKTVITDTFPETNVKSYTLKCSTDSSGKQIKFHGLSGADSEFSNLVFNFFQQKIEEIYPLDLSPMDPMQLQKESHETFLDSRSSCVLGRDKMIAQIEDYVVHGSSSNAPLLVVGIAGAGKSALMAKCAFNATYLVEKGMIKMPCKSSDLCKVFFHFVGATPRSTDLASFLQRLTKEMKPDLLDTLSDLDSLINLAYNLLENPNVEPIIIFVDAINQMDEDKHQYLKRWIPEQLSPNVRLILSTIEGTVSHQAIRSFKSNPSEIICGALDKESREAIVVNILRTYNKRLDPEQMGVLLDKVGSRYPLWLTLACEELRVFGSFETLINKIEELPDDLISLEEMVFERFEGEAGGDLMKACVCMLEVSRHGLLETELLALLGEERNIKLPEYKGEMELESMEVSKSSDGTTENIEDTKQNISKLVQETYVKEETASEVKKEKVKFKRPKGKVINFLPAREWAIIYRNLKPLLRPCGDLGEGRLDFYHRSLSKAVRKRYFSGDENEKRHKYNFWHGVLADYFEGIDDMDRKAEELPYHLEQLLDNNRLIRCLMDWEVFDRMFSEDFSIDLLHSWRKCGGYGIASAVYREQLAILRNSDMPLVEYVEIVEKVYGFLIQAGQYAEALELMEQRLNDELNQLGERPDEMADIYQNMARCKSEIDKAEQFINQDQLDDNRLIVEYGRKCLHYRKQLTGLENEYRCALANILIAHHLSNVADLTYDLGIRQEAFAAIDEANQVFTRLNDIGHMAECAMTKAIIDYGMDFPQREALLKEALALCLKGYGEKHLLTTRIYLNTGIAYEMVSDYKTSFHCFTKLKETCLAVFGPGHPKTVRAINTLKESRYQRMEAVKSRTVPEIA